MRPEKVIKVAGYIRISTDETRQHYSLPAQEKRIREYIESRRGEGYTLLQMYSDQKSAANLNRPELQRLLEDAEKGLFSVLLVVKMDRLCRKLADQLFLTDQFEKWHIKLEATDEDIDLESPEGITWAQIRGAFNESERRKNSYRTKRAMREKASQGEWCGGYTPLGYTRYKSKKNLVPDEDHRLVIEKIFYLYVVKRKGAKAIAGDLNTQGFRTRSGGLFSTSPILSIITNPSYTGKIRWDGEIFPGKHEPIIDEETFSRAQTILSERRGDPSLRRSNSSEYPLSGLLRCQICGRPLVGVSAHGRNRVYHYYVCPSKLDYGECGLENLPRDTIDLAILSQIKEIFLNGELINKTLRRVNEKRAEKLPKKQTELRSVQREISRKKSIIQRYLTAFESGPLKRKAKSVNEKVLQIEDEIALLEEREASLKDEINSSTLQPVTAEDLGRVIGKLEEVISSAGPSERKAFLRNVVKTIKVYSPSHIEPYYRIPPVRVMSGLAPRVGRIQNFLLQ